MYKRIITFSAMSLMLVAAMPAVVTANISNIDRQQILSQLNKSSSKASQLNKQADSSVSKLQNQIVKKSSSSQ